MAARLPTATSAQRIHFIRTSLAQAAALLALAGLAASPCGAQQAPSANAQRSRYAIPPGSLEMVLNRFGREAGILLSFPRDLAEGWRSPGLSGSYTVPEALKALLDGSAISATPQTDGGYTLARMPPDEKTMATVTVIASAEREDPAGPANGYVAHRSLSASKTDTTLIELPQSISIVTATQLSDQQPRDLVEALAYTAGVTRSEGSDRTTDSFVIRGFQAGAANGSMYRDGAKLMVNAYDGQQELYGLERIEVLKGAASLLYGSAAPGGIINTSTKQPNASSLHEVGVEVGDYSRRQLKGDFAGALSADGTLSYRLTGLMRDSHTFIEQTPDNRRFIAGAVKWQPDSATSLTVRAEYLHNRTNYVYGLPAEGTILPSIHGQIPDNTYTGTPGYDKYDGTNYALGYQFEHRFSSGITLRHSARAFKSNVDFPSTTSDGIDPGGTKSTYHAAQDRTDYSRAFTTDTALEYHWDRDRLQHTLLVGVDTTRQHHETRRADRDIDMQFDYYKPSYQYTLGTPVQNTYYPDSGSNDTGLYLQDQIKIDRRWVVVLGGRRDRDTERQIPVDGVTPNSKEATAANTGRAGLIYLFENGFAPFASYSQSFQPQSGADQSGRRFSPTLGEQYEAGLRYQPASSDTLVTASLYRLTQTNVLSTDPLNTNFSVQTGAIESRGLELEAKTQLSKATSVIAAYAYTHAEVTRDTNPDNVGKRRGNVPYHTASVWVEHDFGAALLGLSGGLGVRYVGSSLGLFVDGTVRAYTVADAMLAYDRGPWRLALNVSNLTDKRYIASCTYGCFYAEPRKAALSAIYHW